MDPGQEIAKWLKPGGCALVILISALMLIICFTSGKDPLDGYTAAQTTEYYSMHPDELKSEMEQNVFPELSGIEGCEITPVGKLLITLSGYDYAVARSAILRYYDKSLFEFENPSD